MDGYRLQILLFDLIRERVDNPKNWIDEIAEKLNLSKSAVYKKVNATSSLSLEELSDLLVAYDINFDQLIRPETTSLRFSFPGLMASPDPVEQMLVDMTTLIDQYREYSEARLDIVATGMPLFYWFMDRHLCHYKLFYLSKAFGEEGQSAFSLNTLNDDATVYKKARELLSIYMHLPGIEIWHPDVMTHAIAEVNFSLKRGHFADKSDAIGICQGLKSVLGHIEAMVRAEKKFLPEGGPESGLGDLEVFEGDSELSDDNWMFSSDAGESVICTVARSAYLSCRDERFSDFIRSVFERNKAMAESVSSKEARREAFFERLHAQVDKSIHPYRNTN